MSIKLQDSSNVTAHNSWVNNRRSILSSISLLLLLTTWYFLPITESPKLFQSSLTRLQPPPSPILIPTPENYQDLVKPITLENATAIFNTVLSALRPKHSQLIPNGVSFIPAYIPQGSLLYHGNNNGEIPKGLEWVAFDHEFSMNFIDHRLGMGGPPGFNGSKPGHGPKHGKHKGPPPMEVDERGPPPPPPPHKGGPGNKGPFGPSKDRKDHPSMLTFQVVRPLDKMILLDGSSAAKSRTGEMDTQMILARAGVNETMREYEAAEKICEWGKPFGIDGYIRVEVGFEAVICDFHSEKLKLISNVTIERAQESLKFPLEDGDDISAEEKHILDRIYATAGYEQVKQGNVHDKRDGRILLDFRGLVTPLNRTWVNPDPYLRRIYNVSSDLQDELIQDLGSYMSSEVNPYLGTDWQLVVDEIIDKLAPMLKQLNDSLSNLSQSSNDEKILESATNCSVLTSNFVRRFADFNIKDIHDRFEKAKKQATYQYSHPLQHLQSESDVLIWSSITHITSKVVDTIFEISKHSGKVVIAGYVEKTPLGKYKDSLLASQENLNSLLETLNWPIYYECDRLCGWNEVCYTPSWGPNPLSSWGKDVFGTITKEGETRARVVSPLQCISVDTILEYKSKRQNRISN